MRHRIGVVRIGVVRIATVRIATVRVAIVLLLLAAGPAAADQYSYVSVQQAAQAMQAIAEQDVVHAFCAPCGDARSRPLRVRQVDIGRVWDGSGAQPYRAGDGQTFWQVYVNDAPVDLAYVYVHADGRWENLALRLGLPASDVPRTLDPTRTGR